MVTARVEAFLDGQWTQVGTMATEAPDQSVAADADEVVLPPWGLSTGTVSAVEEGQVTLTLRLQTAQFSQAVRELHRSTLRLWLYGESRADSARRRRVTCQMALVRRAARRRTRTAL